MVHEGTRAGGSKGRAKTRKRPSSRGRPKRRRSNLFERSDIVEFVSEKAARIASPDVAELLTHAPKLRGKAAMLRGSRFEPLRRQINDALECLDDYLSGRCPQIPYYTISVLAAALFYFRKPFDALPDFLPNVGALDDALVMTVATDIAREGLDRYHTWKSLSRELPEQEARAVTNPPRRARSRPKS